MNKYRNKKVIVDDYVFDSIQESRRYKELKLLLKAGKIKDLKLQPRFLLQKSFKKNSKTYRKIEYVADFQYIDTETEKIIVEDVKSKATITQVYKIKKKMFEYRYPNLEIREILY